jgi:hypothetical protein
MMHQHDAHEHDAIPDGDHGGIGTSAGIRLVDRINTWKAFVGVSRFAWSSTASSSTLASSGEPTK